MRLGCGQRAARQVVELHGGEIVASSDGPGRGARFSLCLPLTPDAAGDPAPRGTAAAVDRDAAAEQLAGRRVLVVEDDADARKLLCELLRMHGAEVHGAGSATQALGLLDAIDADILVSDIGMPGRDGYWLIAEVRRRHQGNRHLPALALTAFAGEVDRRSALEAGFDAYLSKPVDEMMLVRCVADLIREACPGT